MTIKYRSKFVIVATVAAEITHIMDVVKDISLVSRNAKAISFRVSDKAKGFHPITDFINELAYETSILAHAITKRAFILYDISMEEYRLQQLIKELDSVYLQSSSIRFYDSLKSRRLILDKKLKKCSFQLTDNLNILVMQLNDISRLSRSARVIAANSRIEASRAGEFQQSLEGVAESVDQAGSVIYDNVQRCHSVLARFSNIVD